MRRAIEHLLEDPLSEEILRGNFKGKDLIRISMKTESDGTKHLYFDAIVVPKEKSPEAAPTTASQSDAT